MTHAFYTTLHHRRPPKFRPFNHEQEGNCRGLRFGYGKLGMGAQLRPGEIRDAPVPFVGQSLRCLVGELEEQEDLHTFEFIEPPEAYDLLLRVLSYAAPTNPKPIESNWT